MASTPTKLPEPPSPGAQNPDPTDQLLGTTQQAPTPDEVVMPRVGGRPFGQSGRANFWGLPQPDEINPQLVGPQGLRRLNEMYRTDAHARRLVLAAWSPIVAGTWTLEPYGGEDTTDADKQVADEIWWLLTEYMSPNFTEHLAQAGPLLLRSGFCPFESVGWGPVKHNGKTLLAPRKLDVRLPVSVWKWWQDDFGEMTHIGQVLPNKADVVIPSSELVYYRLGAEGDNWAGTSLLRHAWKHWFLKDKLERIDAIGQERKAVGVPVCYPPRNASEEQRGAVELLLANLHMSEAVYLMMPGPKAGSQGSQGNAGDEWLIDIIKFDSSAGTGIMESLAYHQTAMAASFLTDFLELGHHQVGARATAEVQEDPFLTAVNGALLPPVVPPLNRFIDRLRKLNWDNVDGSPTLKLTLTDQASLSEVAAYVVPLVQAGAMQVDPELEDYLRDFGGLPPADADIRASKQAAQQAGFDAAAELANRGETPSEEPPSPNADPAKPGQDATAPARPGQPNPIAGAVQNTGKVPDSGKQLDNSTLVAAGIVVHARNTGRLLAVRRTPDDSDPMGSHSKWEFPGGHVNESDPSAWQGALREFGEETGATLPRSTEHAGQFTSPNGLHRTFVVHVPTEQDVTAKLPMSSGHLGDFAPDHNEVSQIGWRYPDVLDSPGTRDEVRASLPKVKRLLGLPEHQLLDAPASIATGDRVSRSAPDLALVGPIGTVTDCPVDPASGAVMYDVDWDDGSSSEGMRDYELRGLDENRTLDVPSPDAPTPKWFERLVSQDRLREVFDGARDNMQAACEPQTLTLARKAAHQAANQAPVGAPTEPPADLVDALAQHYSALYQLGRETTGLELARQRAHLSKTLDEPPGQGAAPAAASRVARGRQRAEHSARNIQSAVNERLGRDQITGLKDETALRAGAEQVATGQLRKEALSNVAAMVNDGRADAAQSDSGVVGGIYTSVLDPSTCGACEAADTGDVLSMEDASALGPPNPDCEGGDFCRCLILWVLSDDPAALAAVS